MATFSSLDKKVEELARQGRVKIAFGMNEPNGEIIESLERCKKYADIKLVGPEAIKGIAGFEKIITNEPEIRLATMLAHDEVEGIVRGTIDDFKTIEAYEKLTGEKTTICPSLHEDTAGRQFFMVPNVNMEGWTKEERLELADTTAQIIAAWEVEPIIAVFCGRRHDTYARRKEIRDGINGMLNQTYEDAEWIVARLKEKGYNAKNWSIDLNPAVEAGCNLLVPVNGMVGNQIFRAMLICGGRLLTGTRIGLSRAYEDNSRTERDYDYHIKFLTALINRNKRDRT